MTFDGEFNLAVLTKNKKVLAGVVTGGLLAIILIVFLLTHKSSLNSNLSQSPAETKSSVVGSSEDSRTLGYPDTRKVVRASNTTLYAAYRAKDSSRKDSYQIFVTKSTNNGQSWNLANGSVPVSDLTDNFNQRVPSLLFADKTLYIVWYGADNRSASDKNHQIFFSKSTNAGKSFAKPKNIYFVDGYYGQDTWQEHPIIYKTDGRLLVTWEGKDQSHSLQQIKLSTSDDNGSTWQVPVNVNADQSRTFSRPDLLAVGGKLWLFCYSGQDDGSNNQVYSAVSYDQGGTWSGWQALTDKNQDSRHVSSVADMDGRVYLAYRVYSGGNSTIAYRVFDPAGSQWSAQKNAPKSADGQFFPSLGYINGQLYLAFSIESTSSANPPKEDLNDNASSVLLGYSDKSKGFSRQITTIKGSWLNLGRSGSHLEGLLVKPSGNGSYDINYYQWNTNKL